MWGFSDAKLCIKETRNFSLKEKRAVGIKFCLCKEYESKIKSKKREQPVGSMDIVPMRNTSMGFN